MARGGKKEVSAAAADPVVEERLRLKKLAFSKNILSQAKVAASAALGPSKTLIKHHGKDILRKSQRKNKYLFSFPGLLGPVSGGKIGELKDLATKNPILYLDFPQGQMKLFGTIVYPKNRYLTLQFSKGGKNVTCDDYFDNMIVFSEAWWIGKKEDNPEELQLQFPKELNKENHTEYDFKAGVGAPCDSKQSSGKIATKSLEREPPKVDTEDDITDSPNDYKELAEVTPTRKSARIVGKTFKFAKSSSEDDFIGNEDVTREEDDEEVDNETIKRNAQTGSPRRLVFEDDNNDNAKQDPASGKNKHTGNAEDSSDNGRRSLVQTTLSSLFKKAEDKKVMKDVKRKTTISEAFKHMKGGKKIERRKSGTATKEQKKQPEEADDEIEDISSASQDMDESDEDFNFEEKSDEDWSS